MDGVFGAWIQQVLQSIADIVRAAVGEVTGISRLARFVTDKTDRLAHRDEVGAACHTVLGRHFPAISAVAVAGLAEDAAKVEMDPTAHLS